MTERQILYKAVSNAAWGYFFLSLDIYFGSISILPSFVGYLLLLSAIQQLSKERRDLALLRPLAIFLAVWSILAWALSWAGLSLDGKFLLLDLLVIAANLYFNFQFLTDMAALAAAHQPEWDTLDQCILKLRAVYTIIGTFCIIYSELFSTNALNLDGIGGITAFLPFVALAVAVFLVMFSLFRLRRLFAEKATA